MTVRFNAWLLRTFLSVIVLVCASGCGRVFDPPYQSSNQDVVQAGSSEARPKNILFIMSDDHAAHAIGAYRSRLASLDPTPHLDQLAAEGTLFQNVFATNSICTPSRASILTGQYSQTNGVLDLAGSLHADRQELPKLFSAAGYQTALIGKWHLRDEPAAFDHYKVLPGQGQYFDPDFRVRGERDWPHNV